MIEVEEREEAERGCGYRQPGGLYLIGVALDEPCGGLPVPLLPCHDCGQQVKQARAWTWIEPLHLFEAMRSAGGHHMDPSLSEMCHLAPSGRCDDCPVKGMYITRAGLVWVGRSHYPSAAEFLSEAAEVGISRRIGQHLPRDYWEPQIHSVEIHVTHKGDMMATTQKRVATFSARTAHDAEQTAVRVTRQEERLHHDAYDVRAVCSDPPPLKPPWVFVAHPRAFVTRDGSVPGVIAAFQPRVERVLGPDEEPSEHDARRGITQVRVTPI